MKLYAQSMSITRPQLPNFEVTGGPLNGPQHMGWHITNEKGLTIAISNDSRFCEHLNELERVYTLFTRFLELEKLRGQLLLKEPIHLED